VRFETFTGQHQLMVGSLTVATGKAALQIYEANADTNTAKYNLSMDWPNEAKRQLLPHCCKLSDKNSFDISRDIWNLSQYFKSVFVYFTISRETPNDMLQNAGWEMLC